MHALVSHPAQVTDPSVRGLWPEPLTPAVTDLLSQATVLGVTLFFHSYIVTVPSWVNEKARGTSVARGIWIPTAATAAIKVVFGLAGAWAFRLLTFPHGVGGYPRGEPLPGASNILSHMLDCVQARGACSRHGACVESARAPLRKPTASHAPSPASPLLQTMATRYAVYAFTVLTLVPGIPIISILTRCTMGSASLPCALKGSVRVWCTAKPCAPICHRYNLLSGDLCSPATAYAVGVVLPWILTAFTYNRGALLTTCNWVALLVQGYTNFVLPVAMYRGDVLWYTVVLFNRTSDATSSVSPIHATSSLRSQRRCGGTSTPGSQGPTAPRRRGPCVPGPARSWPPSQRTRSGWATCTSAC